MICNKCGAELENDALFCSECGTKIEKIITETSSVIPSKKKCMRCGIELDSEALFCYQCGNRIENCVESTTEETSVKKCKKCGAELDDDAAFCSECGSKVGDNVISNTNNEPVKICFKCRNAIPNESLYCDHCGVPLNKTISETGRITENTGVSQDFRKRNINNKDSKKAIIAIVSALIVCCVLAVGFGIYQDTKQRKNNQQEENETKYEEIITPIEGITNTQADMQNQPPTQTAQASTSLTPVKETQKSDSKKEKKKPTVSAYAKTYTYTGYEGSTSRLFVSGDFDYIELQKAYKEGDEYDDLDTIGGMKRYSKSECADYIDLHYNASGSPQACAYITPYYNDGTAGEQITCYIPYSASEVIRSGSVGNAEVNMKGVLSISNGAIVAGYTSAYVCDGGACSKIRDSLGDGWKVTARNRCYNYEVTWYELWDTEDGDYYGWVDSRFIQFY